MSALGAEGGAEGVVAVGRPFRAGGVLCAAGAVGRGFSEGAGVELGVVFAGADGVAVDIYYGVSH